MKISTYDFQRTKKNHTRALLAVLALFGAFLGINVAVQSSAHAVGGCTKQVVDRTNTMTQDMTYSVPSKPPIIETSDLRVTGTLMYWDCRYETVPSKVRSVWINWCYSFTRHQEHRWFEGVRFNAYIWDGSGKNVNPASVLVKDDGTVQNCRRQDINMADSPWMLRPNDPRWRSPFAVVLNDWPDSNGDLKSPAGYSISYLRPSIDRAVSGAHW